MKLKGWKNNFGIKSFFFCWSEDNNSGVSGGDKVRKYYLNYVSTVRACIVICTRNLVSGGSYVTLRVLASESYLVMTHHHLDSVSKVIWRTVKAVDTCIDNINLPSATEEILSISKVWSDLVYEEFLFIEKGYGPSGHRNMDYF